LKFLTKKEKETIIPTVYIAVGVPNSGKTFWWKQSIENGLIPENMTIYINPEEQAKELAIRGDIIVSIANEYSLSLYKNSLSVGIPIIYFDGYFITKESRKLIIDEAKKIGYKVVCLWFNVSLKKCEDRNKDLKQKIKIVDEYIQKEPPSLEEGFDSIWEIK
jgi:predicted kinase